MIESSHHFTHRVLLAVGMTTSVVLLVLLLWYAVDVLLLAFAGILLAIFLRGLSDWISEHTPLSDGWSLAVVTLGLISMLAIGMWLVAPDVAEQIDELRKSLPQSVQQLAQRIERYDWGRQLLAQKPNADELMPDKADVLARATGVFSTTLGAFAKSRGRLAAVVVMDASASGLSRASMRINQQNRPRK